MSTLFVPEYNNYAPSFSIACVVKEGVGLILNEIIIRSRVDQVRVKYIDDLLMELLLIGLCNAGKSAIAGVVYSPSHLNLTSVIAIIRCQYDYS